VLHEDGAESPPYDICVTGSVYDNYFDDNGNNGTAGLSGGIWMQYCDEVEIYRNFIKASYESGITINDNESSANNNEVHHNIIDSVNTGSVVAQAGIALDDAVNPKVYNNTIYNVGTNGDGIQVTGTTNTTGVTIKNNLIDTAAANLIDFASGTTTSADVDYNRYNPDGASQFVWNGSGSDDFADWQSDSGQDSNGSVGDPLFTAAGTGDFTLASGSPAIDSGIGIGAAYDDGLNSTSSWPSSVSLLDQDLYGEGWEMGAYVYSSGVTPLSGHTEYFFMCDGGDGTLPETNFCDTAWDSGDITNSGNWAATDTDDGKLGRNDLLVVMDDGGTFYFSTGYFAVYQSGESGKPITIEGQSGDSPEFRGTTAIASWTENTGANCGASPLSNTWCTAYTANDPNLMWEGSTAITDKKTGAIGDLSDYGDFFHDDGNDLVYMYKVGDPGADVEIASVDTALIWIDQKDYITIKDIALTRANEYGLRLSAARNIIIDNVDSSWAYYYGIGNNWNSTTLACADVTIKNSEVSYNGGDGITFNTATYPVTGLVIQNNTVHHNSQLDQDPDCTPDSGHCTTAGIKLYAARDQAVDEAIIEENLVYQEGVGGAAASNERGNGIWIDQWGDGTIAGDRAVVRYNRIYSNIGAGIVSEYSGYHRIHNNIVYNNGSGHESMAADFWGAGILLYRDVNDNLVYGNTSYGNTKGIACVGESSGSQTNMDDNLFSNNATDANVDEELYVDLGCDNNDLGSGNSYQYNSFDAESTDFIYWDADATETLVDTYDEFEDANHYNTNSNSIEADLDFTDVANNVFTLQPGSPGIDTGTDLGDTYDMAIAPGSVWPSSITLASQDKHRVGAGNWSIGAYVYRIWAFGTSQSYYKWSTWHLGSDARLKGEDRLGFVATGANAWASSDVFDTGRTTNYVSISQTVIRGTLTYRIRGQAATFNWDAGSPSWETYAGPYNKDWRYIQIRVQLD
jgi:hypothetical protein